MNKKAPKIISLSHLITNDTLMYPGDPEIKIKDYKTIDSHGSWVKQITFGSHTGTHQDAPSHILKQGSNLDEIEKIQFIGVARCINLKDHINLKTLLADLNPGEAIFFNTGHAIYWNTEKFYRERPYLSDQMLNTLIQKKASALGIDTPSVDPRGSKNKHIHKKLLKNNILIYESLANLDRLPENEPFVYAAVPLPFAQADASPLQMIALVGDNNLVSSISTFKKHFL